MASFRDVDIELQRYLETEGAGPASFVVRQELSTTVSKKLKTVVGGGADMDFLHSPTNTGRTNGKAPSNDPPKDGRIMKGWWQAMTAEPLQASGLPSLPQSPEVMLPTPSKKIPKKRRCVVWHLHAPVP